jgi:TraM recognition site of TraD and TraG
LGTFIVSKLHQAAMSRQIQAEDTRSNFFLYIDEFQHFITPSMASILSGTRKYHLGLIVSHQSMNQLQRSDTELASDVIANAGTRICFRLGDTDARNLEDGFSFFDAKDLQNLGVGEAIMRIDRSENDFSLTTNPLVQPVVSKDIQAQIIAHSRKLYATPKKDVEAMLATAMQIPEEKEPPSPAITQVENKEEVVVKLPESIQQKPSHAPIQSTDEIKSEPIAVTPSSKKEESQHRYLQTLIKRMAEDFGYKTTIEEATPDGKGKVDVGLLRNDRRIACEISVTTTAQWEIHNIEKCLTAGYDIVIICSTDKKNLVKIQKLIEQKLDAAVQSKVLTLVPDELFLYLSQQIAKEESTEERINGFRVKVSYNAVPQEAAKQKKEQIVKTIINSMRKKDQKK